MQNKSGVKTWANLTRTKWLGLSIYKTTRLVGWLRWAVASSCWKLWSYTRRKQSETADRVLGGQDFSMRDVNQCCPLWYEPPEGLLWQIISVMVTGVMCHDAKCIEFCFIWGLDSSVQHMPQMLDTYCTHPSARCIHRHSNSPVTTKPDMRHGLMPCVSWHIAKTWTHSNFFFVSKLYSFLYMPCHKAVCRCGPEPWVTGICFNFHSNS